MKKVLSTKDVSYLSDMFNWNITTYNKLCLYSNEIKDESLANEINMLCDLHINNCNKIIKILESGEE